MKKVLGIMVGMVIIFSCLNFSSAENAAPSPNEDVPKVYLQYFVKWDDELEPEESFITEAEYLTTLDMDKNENGIWDVLEEDEEEVIVRAAAAETGILGDLNGDMFVDNRDVVLMYRHVAGWNQDINTRVLDFNGDGYVNIGDANHLMKYVSGWPNTILYKGVKYDIVYHLLSEGMYQEAQVNNVNPNYYYSSDGLTLKNITADGYIFEGWYDGEGSSAERIKKIDAGETGEIELYARWTPRNYKIDFDSDLVAVDSKYYTIETGATLTNPSLANYTFVGWTNQEDGRLVRGIPKGTFGNLTLSANWASRRNQTKPVQSLGEPIIVEDSENGKILFIYRIGDIENVPLFTLYRFSTAEGIASSVTLTEQTSISASDARTISQTVANATTDSATWTLSEGWNNSTSVSEESAQQSGKTIEEAETIAKSSTNTYRLDSSQSESDVVTDSGQYAFKAGGQKSHSDSSTDERGWKSELSVDAGAEMGFGGLLGSGPKYKAHLDIGVSHEDNGNHTETSTDSWSNTIEGSTQTSKATTNTKSWNSTSSYSNSNTMSDSQITSLQISQLISSRYGYGQSYSQNGNESSGQAFTTQNSQQDSYSNTVTYNESKLISKVEEYQTDGKIDGYYRQVLAGTAHVFAVVGYDVATSSYFVYTFTVMDDETYQFLDYSKTTPNFNDKEIGVIPFEIPVFVNEYVNSRIAHSTGLEININTGTVTDYSGDDPIVVVPSYVNVDNGDGTYSSVKITGIESEAFKGNTTLQGIMLSEFIREIPASAFEGCTNLRDVYIPSLTSIGNRAFYGCTSLSKLTIPADVVSLGTNAFYNVNNVEIIAANKNVALAAMNSGAKNLVLNISSINTQMKDAVMEAPAAMNSFELRGERKQYENLRIKSNASVTKINGVSFVNCTQIPLELHSTTVELNQTNVSASGYCMILAENTCNLNLFGTSQMSSSGGGAIVCGATTLSNTNSSVQAVLQVSGNIYVCGDITNAARYLNHKDGSIIAITPEQFADLESFMVVLPTSVSIAGPKTMYVGTTISLTASVEPDDANNQTVNWSSSNKSVATVDSEGVVTGIKAGTTDISVTANGDPNVKSTVTITVQPPYVTGIAIVTYPATTGYIAGDAFSAAGLTIKATYNDGTVENHSASDCTFSSPDMKTTGTKQVTVSYGGKSATFNITVNALTVSLSANTSNGSNGYINLSASVPRGTVSWASSNSNVATVDSSGKVTFKKTVGTAKITATVNNNGVTNSASKTITISNSQGTKFGETSSSTTGTVLYGTRPNGYSTELPVTTGVIPSYTTNSADMSNSSTTTSTGRIDVTYANNGVDGYVYYQFNYNHTGGSENEYIVINYQEGYRRVYKNDGTNENFKFHTSNFGRQFYSYTDYPEHEAKKGWTQYTAIYWAYQDKQAGHTWYVAKGIDGALAASWYRFPLTKYTKTTTTYTYYYYTMS